MVLMSSHSVIVAPDKSPLSASMKIKPRSSSIRDTDSGYGTGENTPGSSQGSSEFGCKRLWTRVKLQRFDVPIQKFYLERFEELQDLLGKPLADHVLHNCVTFSAISMKIMCLGRSKSEAKPWIVVQCDPKIVRHIRRFFAQRDIKDQLQPLSQKSDLPNFEVLVHGTPPEQLAAVSMLEHKSGQVQEHSLCGTKIRLEMDSEDDSQVRHCFASIGGLVCISVAGRQKFYATTVEHIVPTWPKHSTEGQLSNGDSDVETELSASLQSDIMEDEIFELTVESDDPFTTTNFDGDKDTEKTTQALDMIERTNSTAEDDIQWRELGILHRGHTTAEANLDWAAIEIIDPMLLLPNASSNLLRPEGDYQELRTYIPTRKLEHREAIILDGDGLTRGGELSTAPSFLLLPSRTNMTKTYVLKLDSKGALQKGDCGKWVVDPHSFEVFGQIVGVDAFSEAFIVPMHEILDQMRRHFSADYVRLAERADIERRFTDPMTPLHVHDCETPQHSFDPDSAYVSMTSTPENNYKIPGGFSELDRKPWVSLLGVRERDYQNVEFPRSRAMNSSASHPSLTIDDIEDHDPPQISYHSKKPDSEQRNDTTSQDAQTSSTVAANSEDFNYEKQLKDHPTLPYISLDKAMRCKAGKKRLGCEGLVEKSLGNRDIVFLIDDSTSMKDHWHAVADTLMLLAYNLKASDSDGMDMYFTNSNNVVNSKSSSDLVHALPAHVTSGALSIEHRLDELLLKYRQKLEIYNAKSLKDRWSPSFIRSVVARKRRLVKPLSIYILTDARFGRCDFPHAFLIDTIQDLQRLDYDRRMLSIEFIHFGTDPDGKKQLDALQNLDVQYSLPFDIVDTTPVTGNFVKMLVGATLGVLE